MRFFTEANTSRKGKKQHTHSSTQMCSREKFALGYVRGRKSGSNEGIKEVMIIHMKALSENFTWPLLCDCCCLCVRYALEGVKLKNDERLSRDPQALNELRNEHLWNTRETLRRTCPKLKSTLSFASTADWIVLWHVHNATSLHQYIEI